MKNLNNGTETVMNRMEMYELVTKNALFPYNKYYQIRTQMDLDDFIMEAYVELLKREAHTKYDASKGAKSTYVSRLLGRIAIDLTRKINSRAQEIFESNESTKDGDIDINIIDLAGASDDTYDESEVEILKEKLLSALPNAEASKRTTVTMRYNGIEEPFNQQSLMRLSIEDYTPSEIANMCFKQDNTNVSSAYVCKALKKAKEELEEQLYYALNFGM